MGSDTAAVVTDLGLLAPDTSTVPLLSEGFTAVSVQMKAAWSSHKVPGKENASIDTHPAFHSSGWKGMGTLEK